MRYGDHRLDSLYEVRCVLAGAAVDLALLRLELLLERKFSPDQPRVPAGQPGGGRWLSDGDGDPETTGSIGEPPADGAPAAGASEVERTSTEDGSRVLTIRIHARPRPFDEQSTVVAPDGESRVFETSGATQTIRDGDTGEVLGRSTFTARGAEPEATAQPAFLAPLARAAGSYAVRRTLELAGALFAALSARNSRGGTAVLGMSAQEYHPADAFEQNPAIWVGRIDQADLDAACPRNGEVQSMTDAAVASVRQDGLYKTSQDFGNKVHARIAQVVKAKEDPNFVAELSVEPMGSGRRYGRPGTLRLDLVERTVPGTTCVYDYKTGRAGLDPSRALDLATVAKRHFPDTQRIIIIQVRPSS